MFDRFASWVSAKAGHPLTFSIAAALIACWLATGPFLHYSNTWQLIVNTATTVVTFLMIFLLQHSQDRDTREMRKMLKEILDALERTAG